MKANDHIKAMLDQLDKAEREINIIKERASRYEEETMHWRRVVAGLLSENTKLRNKLNAKSS